MKILVTGSAGRVGRAIYIHLMRYYDVVGLDKTPCSTADYVGDLRDSELIESALCGVDVVVHTAALHAPHVGRVEDKEFEAVNVEATEKLALAAVQAGVKQFVFTSTTALYGYASKTQGKAAWINESVLPQPKTIYHRSKIAAEHKLEQISHLFQLPVTVLQMSRCFPEPVDLMAIYRLNRGVDARDVAAAHHLAVQKRLTGFRRFIISATTPFHPQDSVGLCNDAAAVIRQRAPEVASCFDARGWVLPVSLDRVYDSSLATKELGWVSRFGVDSVLSMYDEEFAEVLPPT